MNFDKLNKSICPIKNNLILQTIEAISPRFVESKHYETE
ncbi:hypothetical protein LPE509_01236 [Legionella pneumophila subsp. pneumophila LPE509]|nr:hypothetical protein LPE509_01236 [Legionella pneumophila subsp. pneumophila LPE509]